MKTKKLALNSLLLAVGLLLHQLTPALGFLVQPDLSLIMLFIILIINKDDFKMCLACGVVTGIFSALTTKFPGGQFPNIIDKTMTVVIVYFLMISLYKILEKIDIKKRNLIVVSIMMVIGTLISGVIFLGSASIIAGLPASFSILFMSVVVPAMAINLLVGIFLYKIVDTIIK